MTTCCATVSFPAVLKMTLTTTIPIDKKTSLDFFKQKIFQEFWNKMKFFSPSGIHGDSQMIQISYQDKEDGPPIKEIKTDEDLQERITIAYEWVSRDRNQNQSSLSPKAFFTVYFNKHP